MQKALFVVEYFDITATGRFRIHGEDNGMWSTLWHTTSSSAIATVYQDGTFDIVPLSPEARCSPISIAAHIFYEKSRPDILPGPGESLDLNSSQYEQLSDDCSVRIRGAQFLRSRERNLPYTEKVEAAKTTGYRTMIMGGIRDPILIRQIDQFLARVKEFVRQQHQSTTEKWEVDFHVYCANGIMGSQEPGDSSYTPREIFLVGEALASSQMLATSVASTARIACVHEPYPGQRGTSGNFAMSQGGKLEIEVGHCAELCIYHLISLNVGEEGTSLILDDKSAAGNCTKGTGLFSWKLLEFGTAESDELNLPQPPGAEFNASTSSHGIKRPPTPPVSSIFPTPLHSVTSRP